MIKNSLNARYMDLKPQDLYILAPVRKLFPLELLPCSVHNCYVPEMLTNRFLNGPVLQMSHVCPAVREIVTPIMQSLCKISQNSRLSWVRFGQCWKTFDRSPFWSDRVSALHSGFSVIDLLPTILNIISSVTTTNSWPSVCRICKHNEHCVIRCGH